jgi:hypothetical protein
MGVVPANDVFSEIVLAQGSAVENYNFEGRPSANDSVAAGHADDEWETVLKLRRPVHVYWHTWPAFQRVRWVAKYGQIERRSTATMQICS